MKFIPVDFDPFIQEELLLTVPVTESQKEILHFPTTNDELNCAFNLSNSLCLKGDLNVDALRYAFNQLVVRHQSFRSKISADGTTFCILQCLNLESPYLDISDLNIESQKARLTQLKQQEVIQPFDLQTGPLLRVSIIKTQPQEHWLLITIHHIIF